MPDSPLTHAWGYGLATVRLADGEVLDTWFPSPALGALPEGRDRYIVPADIEHLEAEDARRGVRIEARTVEIELAAAPASTPDAYLRLHLLSHRLVRPNTINLDGVFAHLPIVMWTTAGPVHPDDFDANRPALQRSGVSPLGVDKFPRLLDYVTPTRVRIADASRVRLGAYLSPGTTVMHEGFVNFNAGTLGASMVEGRISQGVVVGDGSDIGGGASAEVMAAGLDVILGDAQVKSVFVNVFGGITACDAVANGIVKALEILGDAATKPLVVRLDGNNVEEGRRILADANHPLVTIASSMDEGADKAAELAAK